MKAISFKHVSPLLVGLAMVTSAIAKDADNKFVDATKVQTLASGNTWETKKLGGAPGYAYWNWKADGSACMRLEQGSGKCDDTGKWKVDGDRLCWEMQWFGATFGLKSNCVAIADQGKGRYLGIDKQGSKLFDFTVLK